MDPKGRDSWEQLGNPDLEAAPKKSQHRSATDATSGDEKERYVSAADVVLAELERNRCRIQDEYGKSLQRLNYDYKMQIEENNRKRQRLLETEARLHLIPELPELPDLPELPELTELPYSVDERTIRMIVIGLFILLCGGAACVAILSVYQWLQMTMP